MVDGLAPHQNASEQKVIPLGFTWVYKSLLFWSNR